MDNNRFISNYGDYKLLDETNKELTVEELKKRIANNKTSKMKEKRFNRKKISECVKDSIVGFAIGDALGVPLEGMDRGVYKKRNTDEMLGGMSHNQELGTWSDDTSMTLATMDSIITLGEINYDDIAKRFCKWLFGGDYTANGDVFDFGNTTYRALNKFYYQMNDAINCGLKDEYDCDNGSLMRMLPIAQYYYFNRGYDRLEMIDTINNISSITHANDTCKLGCNILCRYIYYLLDGYTKETAYELIQNEDYSDVFDQQTISKFERILDGTLSILPEKYVKSSGYVVDTLEAAIYTILHTDNFKDAIINAVDLGKDTDTIGAIVGSLAGIIYNYDEIPEKWLNNTKKIEQIQVMAEEYAKTIKNLSLNNINSNKTYR